MPLCPKCHKEMEELGTIHNPTVTYYNYYCFKCKYSKVLEEKIEVKDGHVSS